MNSLRNNPPKTLCGINLDTFIDYKDGYKNIPPSNVLSFQYGNNLKVSARPSGTEPKVKFYFMVMNMNDRREAEKLLNNTVKEFKSLLNGDK
jgi:phosphomannomutase